MKLTAQTTAMRVCVVILALLAMPRVVFESRRLLFGQTWYDATDIRNFHNLTTVWLSGNDIYAQERNADYPPASWPLMLPMYILDNDLNRWVFFIHASAVLGFLIFMCVRGSEA